MSAPLRIHHLQFPWGMERTDNIGATVIVAALTAHGHDVSEMPASLYAVDNCDLAIVSIPSTYQMLDYLRVARIERLDRRSGIILIGGFGVQNPMLIREFFDFAYFGRAHDAIDGVARELVSERATSSPHVLSAEEFGPVTIDQAPLTDRYMREEFTGCPLKCHYTYARRYQQRPGRPRQYLQTLLSDSAPEVMWSEIRAMERKPGRLRAAIDGFSERLRFAYGKRIRDDEITAAIEHLSGLGRATSSVGQYRLDGDLDDVSDRGACVVMAYNIGHFPGETSDDWRALDNALLAAEPRGGHVVVIIHTTPFRPSLGTPMQWEGVTLWPEWSSMREREIRSGDITAKYSYRLEGAHTHLTSVIIERLRYHDEPIVGRLLSPGAGSSAIRAERLLDAGGGDYVAELDIGLDPPAPWLSSYIDIHRVRKIARKMRRRRAAWSLRAG